MSIALTTLIQETNRYLEIHRIKDYCPNGLQVEGRPQVRRIVTGVTACQGLLDAAVAAQADLVLVHHGYFWKNEDPVVRGMKRQRLKTLLTQDISLLAYHLPLDVHPLVGNNVQLALRLGLTVTGSLEPGDPACPVLLGCLPEPESVGGFAARVGRALACQPLVVEAERPIRRLAWCSGGGQSYIDQAIAAGVDLYLTGEASEQTYHSAVENGVAFVGAGHHATERYGVQALGQYLAERFAVEHLFIDVPNPI